ncbi:hypothetical protein CFS9_26770 [Flavobacterium sp. CFS9]|uniref:Uncharacterized protein n=1 Tax=Flavobacterium sp. CFS9 TaxID=3143118 RepID=A0AAT9H3J7_9FLAO
MIFSRKKGSNSIKNVFDFSYVNYVLNDIVPFTFLNDCGGLKVKFEITFISGVI